MLKNISPALMLLCIVGAAGAQSQQRSTTVYPVFSAGLIWSPIEDGSITLSVDKLVYFPGDTVRLTIRQNDSIAAFTVTPILVDGGIAFHPVGPNTYFAAIPETLMPGSYHISLKVVDAQGRRFVYATSCVVEVEEYQAVERVDKYASIGPEAGGRDPLAAEVLDREQIKNLHVIFHRDSIREHMGPQFLTITTVVQTREGTMVQTYVRRVMTFRSRGGPNRDLAMFLQYRKAYGAYAVIRPEDLKQVQVEVDSLPDWALVKVSIEPDNTITIGEVDNSNCVTRYFRVEGPSIEVGFTLGIPKVLYDTDARDTIEYGNTSAMMRFYYFDGTSGQRFPVNLGIGTFGVSSPIDISPGRGGFAMSVFLDVVELMRRVGIGFPMRVNAGLELVPFFPIHRRSRVLLNAQLGVTL
jgi:hypothetical protein